MELTDILPLEQWKALEKEINEKSGLDVNVFNPSGYRITDFKNWANKLCPAIKDTSKGQSFICAVAHMNISTMAKQSGKPVIEECDAGLMKLVVPIFVKEEFIGAIGACGHVLDDGEADEFLINKITDIPEETVASLGQTIPRIPMEKAEALVEYIKTKLEEILSRV
ncbi:MAG: PocR ligand-binding domain-containing protein [Proteobacteria bacterium]|nr:PocR ligand-binding domain-containing protein [Pseudomonadota bacterium]MBU4469341.1 PocR ligand-binding domain-containing protein [Pseudomonadota bacterium]MCG2753557.1 PocR ligand-binding domain-containing protein [Desulfobacteraceae bacterium]